MHWLWFLAIPPWVIATAYLGQCCFYLTIERLGGRRGLSLWLASGFSVFGLGLAGVMFMIKWGAQL